MLRVVEGADPYRQYGDRRLGFLRYKKVISKSVGATTMFSKKTCRLAMWSSEVVTVIDAHPSVIFPDRRGRRPRRPEVISVTAALSSVAQKRDLQKPSLVREGGPLAVDE